MKSTKLSAGLAAGSLLMAAAALAQVPGAALNLGPVQPAPGWGTTSTYNVYASVNNRPVSNKRIEFFFSGTHGRESGHYYATTNAQGRATFSVAIPRDWRSSGTWVNANAICSYLGIQNNWRVKQ